MDLGPSLSSGTLRKSGFQFPLSKMEVIHAHSLSSHSSDIWESVWQTVNQLGESDLSRGFSSAADAGTRPDLRDPPHAT